MEAARRGDGITPALMDLATLMAEKRAHSLPHKEVHREVLSFLRRSREALDDKAIAKALIAQAQEKRAVRPTWYFYERIGKEILEALK